MEDKIIEITLSGQQTKKQMKRCESNMRDLWDNIKQVNLRIIRITEGKEIEQRIENIFEEIIAENFTNLKETAIKIKEAQRSPNKLNPNRPTSRYIILKMAKVKGRILKAAREKQRVNYKGITIRLSADF